MPASAEEIYGGRTVFGERFESFDVFRLEHAEGENLALLQVTVGCELFTDFGIAEHVQVKTTADNEYRQDRSVANLVSYTRQGFLIPDKKFRSRVELFTFFEHQLGEVGFELAKVPTDASGNA